MLRIKREMKYKIKYMGWIGNEKTAIVDGKQLLDTKKAERHGWVWITEVIPYYD